MKQLEEIDWNKSIKNSILFSTSTIFQSGWFDSSIFRLSISCTSNDKNSNEIRKMMRKKRLFYVKKNDFVIPSDLEIKHTK